MYTEIAKYADLNLKIVGFPSHVIVKYEEEMILDPFNRGRLLELEDLQEILYQNYGDSVEFQADYLNQISDEKNTNSNVEKFKKFIHRFVCI